MENMFFSPTKSYIEMNFKNILYINRKMIMSSF